MKIGDAFEFASPTGWRESREGPQYFFEGPKDEALIVSGYFVSGPPTPERRAVRTQLLANACIVMSKAASDPQLRELVPLAKREEFQKLEVWSQHNVSTDGVEAFSQAALVGDRGVLLITLESLAAGDHMQVFQSVVSSVSAIPN